MSMLVSISAKVPAHALGPSYSESFVAQASVPEWVWYDSLPSGFGKSHHFQAKELLHLPLVADLRARVDKDYDYHLEDDFVTLLPSRKQLAQVIKEAEAEFGDGATPEMLADFILLKLSEQPQLVKPVSMLAAEDKMKMMAYGDPNLPGFMKNYIAHNGETSQALQYAGSFAATAYLRYIADRNIKEIKG